MRVICVAAIEVSRVAPRRLAYACAMPASMHARMRGAIIIAGAAAGVHGAQRLRTFAAAVARSGVGLHAGISR
jgi:hypothetical protein